MAEDGVTIEARVGPHEVYASRSIIVNTDLTFSLYPIPNDPAFIMTVEIRTIDTGNPPRAWTDHGPNDTLLLVIQRPNGYWKELASSNFLGFAEDESYHYFINYTSSYIGTEEVRTLHFSYMLARRAK